MAGRIGRIDVLDPTLETWTSNKERFYSFFIELDIKDEKSSRTTVPRGRQNVRTVKRLNSPLITDRKHLRGPHKDS